MDTQVKQSIPCDARHTRGIRTEAKGPVCRALVAAGRLLSHVQPYIGYGARVSARAAYSIVPTTLTAHT